MPHQHNVRDAARRTRRRSHGRHHLLVGDQQRVVEEWNKKFQVGQAVEVETPEGTRESTTTTQAELMGHRACVMVADIIGPCELDTVRAYCDAALMAETELEGGRA